MVDRTKNWIRPSLLIWFDRVETLGVIQKFAQFKNNNKKSYPGGGGFGSDLGAEVMAEAVAMVKASGLVQVKPKTRSESVTKLGHLLTDMKFKPLSTCSLCPLRSQDY